MPGLVRKTDRYLSDRASADNSAKVSVQFVMDNIKYLRLVDKTGWKAKRISELFCKLANGEELTKFDRADIDTLYEAVWKGLGEPSVGRHIDKKPRGLRFG